MKTQNIFLSIVLSLATLAGTGQTSDWTAIMPATKYIQFQQGWKIPGTEQWLLKAGYYTPGLLKAKPLENEFKLIALPAPSNQATTNYYGAQVVDVHFWSAKKFLVLRNSGAPMLMTEDGGKNFKEIGMSPSTQATQVTFADASNGLVYGNNCVMHTSDGGKTWDNLLQRFLVDTVKESYFGMVNGVLTTKNIHDVRKDTYAQMAMTFVDSKKAYAYNFRMQTFFRSRDGGKKWTQIRDGNDYAEASKMLKGSNGRQFTAEELREFQEIQRQYQAKYPMQYGSLGAVNIMHVDYNANGKFYGLAQGGTLIESQDEGKTWKRIQSKAPGMNKMFKVGSSHYILSDNYSKVYIWNVKSNEFNLAGNMPFTGAISDLHFADARNGWIADMRGNIYRTRNGGQEWKLDRSLFSNLSRYNNYNSYTHFYKQGEKVKVISMRVVGNNQDIAVGYVDDKHVGEFKKYKTQVYYPFDITNAPDGFLIHTSYGVYHANKDFSKVGKVTGAQLRKIKFIKGGNGFAVGATGMVMKTSDGGKTWKGDGDLCTSYMLYDFAIGKKSVVAVGQYTILRRDIDSSLSLLSR